MNTKKLSIIIITVLFFVFSTEAGRREGRRYGRKPKKSSGEGEDPSIKFRRSVEKYKVMREEEALKKRSLEGTLKKRSLNRRDAFSEKNALSIINDILRFDKINPFDKKYFDNFGNSLLKNNFIIEFIDGNNKLISTKSIKDPFGQSIRYNQNAKTVLRTIKKTVTGKTPYTSTRKVQSNISYQSKTNRVSAVPVTTRKITNTYIKVNTSTLKKSSATYKGVTTTRKVTVTGGKSSIITRKVTVTGSKPTTTKRKVTTTVTKKSTVTVNAATVYDQIYQPKPGTTFQWQLSGCHNVDTSVQADVYDIDLFDSPIEKIKELKNKGKKVICYFSGGTIESWRDDAEKFLDVGVVLEEMEDWEDENWVNIRSSKLKPLIQSRLDLAVEKGCDGVEIDNVDGYTFSENDFTYSEQLSFNKWLADEAHKRNLSIGLKNDMGQIKDLLSHYDWALNEECYEYGECELYKPFIQANKAVFGVSYLKSSKKIADACKLANNLKLDYQIKSLDLDASKIDCSVYK